MDMSKPRPVKKLANVEQAIMKIQRLIRRYLARKQMKA
jgi:hypothetical protein